MTKMKIETTKIAMTKKIATTKKSTKNQRKKNSAAMAVNTNGKMAGEKAGRLR